MHRLNVRLGFAAIIAAAALVGIAIPTWISSPSNVSNVVLSPAFWPYVLSGLLGLTGCLLLLSARQTQPSDDVPISVHTGTAWLRLGGLALLMVLTMVGLPRLGMVWTCMLAFVACAFLLRTRYKMTAIVCAVITPLVLYAFFAHVAGVAIPQGDFVRLP